MKNEAMTARTANCIVAALLDVELSLLLDNDGTAVDVELKSVLVTCAEAEPEVV